jgi:hypothetical protein
VLHEAGRVCHVSNEARGVYLYTYKGGKAEEVQISQTKQGAVTRAT